MSAVWLIKESVDREANKSNVEKRGVHYTHIYISTDKLTKVTSFTWPYFTNNLKIVLFSFLWKINCTVCDVKL